MRSPSSSLIRGDSAFWPCLGEAMASAGDCPLPSLISEVGIGSWSSGAALYQFAWVVKRQCLSQSALHAVPSRAALALWIGGLNLRDFREIGSRVASNDDEGMLNWIVLSVRRGWTTMEVLMWIFPCFRGLLLDMALDVACST